MAALITEIDPGRGRDGDTGIDIIGTGFDGTTNTVTVDGVSATVTFNSVTLVTFTVPAAIALDQWVVVELTNTGDSSVATRKWWSKQTVASLATVRLDVPLKENLHDLEWGGARERLRTLCAQLGDKDLVDRMPRWAG